MQTKRAERTRIGIESLEGRQLTAAAAGLVAPQTAEVRTMAGPSVSEIVVTKELDVPSTGL
jgi:hypothetical protein